MSNESARQLVCNSSGICPDKRTSLYPDSIHSAQCLICRQRQSLALLHTQGHGIRLDKTNSKMTQLSNKRFDLSMLIARHNISEDE